MISPRENHKDSLPDPNDNKFVNKNYVKSTYNFPQWGIFVSEH